MTPPSRVAPATLTLRKVLRANDIAFKNRLPVISLVESGGADLPTQKEVFVPGGQMFRDLTRLSAAGIPTIALVFGNSTAGGAYIPGMSDHVVMIKERSKVFLAGPHWSRWRPAKSPTTNLSVAPRCTPASPVWATIWPWTNRMPCAWVARSCRA